MIKQRKAPSYPYWVRLPRQLSLWRGERLLQFVVSIAVLSSVALIVAAWVGTGALAWGRAVVIRTAVRSSWSAEVHVGFASFDGLDDCNLCAAAGYEVELGIGKEDG